MSRPKRHHYLPESYLNGFTARGRFWVFDRESRQFRPQTPKNTAVETDFYTVADEDGSKDRSLETALAPIDGKAAEVIRELEGTDSVSAIQIRVLALFVALLRVRTPEFEEQQTQLQLATAAAAARAFAEGASAILFGPRNPLPDQAPPKPYTPADLARFLDDLETDENMLRNEARASIPRLALDLGKILGHMNWVFYVPARDCHFMTCDNPFIIVGPTAEGPAGIATPGARKVIPLSSTLLVSIHDEGNGYAWQRMSRRAVEGVNCMCALNSDRFVISRKEYPLRKVVRATNIDRFRRKRRVAVE